MLSSLTSTQVIPEGSSHLQSSHMSPAASAKIALQLSISLRSILLLSLLFSVQFSRSVMSDSLQPHGLQHTTLPCPSSTPRVYSNSWPLSWWCHPTFYLLLGAYSGKFTLHEAHLVPQLETKWGWPPAMLIPNWVQVPCRGICPLLHFHQEKKVTEDQWEEPREALLGAQVWGVGACHQLLGGGFPPYNSAEYRTERNAEWDFHRWAFPDPCLLVGGHLNLYKWEFNVLWMILRDRVFTSSLGFLIPIFEHFKDPKVLPSSQSKSQLLYLKPISFILLYIKSSKACSGQSIRWAVSLAELSAGVNNGSSPPTSWKPSTFSKASGSCPIPSLAFHIFPGFRKIHKGHPSSGCHTWYLEQEPRTAPPSSYPLVECWLISLGVSGTQHKSGIQYTADVNETAPFLT